MVPSTVAIAAAPQAIDSELSAARNMSSSLKSFRYQAVVNPTHSALSFESLKEKMTTMTRGIYRNA